MRSVIQYVRSDDCQQALTKAVESVVHRLRHNCAERRQILLLISGGSNLAVATEALKQLTDEELARIHVAQVDERYVAHDDPNSIWLNFVQAFPHIGKLAGVTPILQEGNSFYETVNNYDLELTNKIKESEYSLALVGVGEDGMIAGMKPLPSIDFQLFFNDDFAAGYEAEDFRRITMTDYGLKVISDIVVYACGKEKRKPLKMLRGHSPVHKHPAQLLKIYDRVTLFTDQPE